jgi:hypothetical protein
MVTKVPVVVGWVQPFSGRAKPTVSISIVKVGSIPFHPPYSAHSRATINLKK